MRSTFSSPCTNVQMTIVSIADGPTQKLPCVTHSNDDYEDGYKPQEQRKLAMKVKRRLPGGPPSVCPVWRHGQRKHKDASSYNNAPN
ncbi:AGAP001579-PA [Anopheles gambiae str. PEST]|uniref:AGAP001579-PA n=1 Tax=Anopheles gambiae TaxID=7165 RepID=Q8T5K9_ANOGA|nr:AGAP001579-PA [Anopheles gambiae str. PEST]CAD27479.1 hypothetical protein [Anopheles gambiae]